MTTGYLIAEEGPLSGMTIVLEGEGEWILGRDPETSTLLLEDPMVSRKHAVCKKSAEGYVLENLSQINPVTQNGKIVSDTTLLREGDILQIGSTYFRFTEQKPEEKKEKSPLEKEPDLSILGTLNLAPSADSRWLLKVISGPNAGAESGLQTGSSYIIGKDAAICDILFQDLSVSRQHAKISLDDNDNLFIEDLNSRNGVLVNGSLIEEKKKISSQDLIALGTTTFMIIDQLEAQETIISAPPALQQPEKPKEEEKAHREKRDWKDLIIPMRYLIIAAIGLLALIGITAALFALFRTETVEAPERNEEKQIKKTLERFSAIQFSFSESNGNLFLVGHVLTSVDKDELLYLIHTLPFVSSIDDNIIIDELVWQNMNALLAAYPQWQGISIHSPAPGQFVISGYLGTAEEANALSDYIDRNFPYLDRLNNEVVVEANIKIEIARILIEGGFTNISVQLNNGDLILSGRVDKKQEEHFSKAIEKLQKLRGIRKVDNFVILSTADNSMMDITNKYPVSGYSKKDDKSFYVVINGKILSTGDFLDGMQITAIEPNRVLLEKDGLKYRISYNQK